MAKGRLEMIISHKHKFIFIKTRRTAGSSIEAALFPFLGPLDIITGSERDGTPRRNCSSNITGHIGWRKIIQLIGEETFWSYRVFCVERDPYAKVVSGYRWHAEHTKSFNGSLLDYVNQEKSISDWDRYTFDRQPVGKVFLFQDLINSPQLVLGLPVKFPHLKKTRTDDICLDLDTTQAIKEKFSNEFKLLEVLRNDKKRSADWNYARQNSGRS